MDLITTTRDLAAACEALSRHDYVAVDTEFMREQTFWPRLCLIQLAAPGIEFAVDPMAGGLDLEPFFELMRRTETMKVFHAARQDIEIVYILSRSLPAPVFDTQVAAMVCGFGDSISYVNLVKRLTGRDLDKSSRFTDWSRRPLSPSQLTYAMADVTHLRDVYQQLQAELDKTGRGNWVAEEMGSLLDPATYEQRPVEAWRRLKLKVRNRRALGVLMELAHWRDETAQTQDVPRNRVLRDDALYDIANQAPTDQQKLGELRSLSDGFARSARAREIIEVVKRGLARDPNSVPPLPSGAGLPAEATAAVELLRVLLKACAARHGVAPRLIADSDDLERLAVEAEPDIPALSGWRRELFGEEALRLKRGERALALRDGGIVVTDAAKAGAGG